MKKQKAMLSLLLAAMLAIPATPFTSPAAYGMEPAVVEAAVKKVKITSPSSAALTIEKGETFQLKASRSNVTWKSSDQKIVSVNSTGMVRGKKSGTATITAKAGKNKASIKVTVGTKVASVTIVKPAVALAAGVQSTIRAAVSPADASNQTLTYSCADPDIASVTDKGVITAKTPGQTTITVQASDGSKKRKTVTVTVRATGSPVRLQDDFYQAINASTLQEHALQGNEYQWSGFHELQNNITKNMNSLIEGLVTEKDQYEEGSMEQKITDFYLLARDMETRDKAGTEPLKPYTDSIDQAQTIDEFVDVLAELGKTGQGSALGFQITQDLKDSNKYMLVNQGPSYILSKEYLTGDANKAIQDAVRDYIKQLFILAGETPEQATAIAAQVFQLEQELSAAGLGLSDRYDIDKIYHPYTKEQLAALYSNCDIEGYLGKLGITDYDQCIVFEEENAKKINSYMTAEHLDLLKNYTKFTLYMNYSGFLTTAHYEALTAINTLITGATDDKDMDTVAKELTQGMFSWEFGKIYSEQYFSKESKTEVEEMTRTLLATFRNRIQRIDWLSETTKQKAMKKLDTMKVKIGYPDAWPSYFDKIALDPSMGLIENVIAVQTALNSDLQKLLDSGVDKNAWVITPQTVNACYNPQANDITFPAAILQAPFYDPDADYAQNLGGIGSVIGHEITHAFDTNGAEYDENGNHNNWWTQADRDAFTAKAEKVKEYYNNMEITNGVFQNGDLTITENIADMGAMACVLEIAGNDKKAILDIFKSNANIWASNQTDQFRDYLLTTDVHSLNKIRVNAILPLFDQFYDVFGVTKNDAMYVAPKNRVQIW